MTLFAAKRGAEEELARTYKELGVTEEEVRAYITAHPEYASPLRMPAKTKDVTGRAALLVHEVAPLIHASRLVRAKIHCERALSKAKKQGSVALTQVAQMAQSLTDSETRSRLKVDARLLGELAKERWAARNAKRETTSAGPSVSEPVSRPMPRREATFEATAEE